VCAVIDGGGSERDHLVAIEALILCVTEVGSICN